MLRKLKVLMLMVLVVQGAHASPTHTVKVMKESSRSMAQEWMGQWVPLQWYPVLSPAHALIEERHSQEGQWVEQGQLILTLASPELHLKLEEAAWEVDQKEQHWQALHQWTKSSDYRQAEQTLRLAQQEYATQARRLEETKSLVLLGGLPKENLTQEEAALLRSQMRVQQAKDHFDIIERKADAQALKKAELELKQARWHYLLCEQKVQNLAVRSKVTGTYYAPHLFSPNQDKHRLVPTQEVEEGQWLGVIAAQKDFGVLFELNEKNMDDFEQADVIEMELAGERIKAVKLSAQPQSIFNPEEKHATYQIKLKPEHMPRQLPRLGAHIRVFLQKQAPTEGLTVPSKAIHWKDGTAFVLKQHESEWQAVPVEILSVFDDKAEIRGELSEGETIGFTSKAG